MSKFDYEAHHGKVCRSCARPLYRCANCNKEFAPMRKDATSCSDACRSQITYNRKRGLKQFASGAEAAEV